MHISSTMYTTSDLLALKYRLTQITDAKVASKLAMVIRKVEWELYKDEQVKKLKDMRRKSLEGTEEFNVQWMHVYLIYHGSSH